MENVSTELLVLFRRLHGPRTGLTQRCQFIKSVGGPSLQEGLPAQVLQTSLICMFFLGFRSPSLYFCSLLYLKLNGKIVSLDKAITVADIGLF